MIGVPRDREAIDPAVDRPVRAMVWRRRAADLIPPSPPGSDRRPWAYLVSFVAAVAFPLLTPVGRSHLDHVWAEDGARFLVDALRRPFWSNLVSPYGGYLHTVPRLLAEPLSLLPLGATAAGLAVAAALVRAAVALLVFAASGAYLRWLPVRAAHAALVVVLPAVDSEALGNLTNLHWFLLYGAFWALLWRPARWAANVLGALVVLLAALSEPLVVLLAPLALLRLALPDRRDRLSAAAFGLGCAGQAVAVLTATRIPYSALSPDPVQLLLASVLRVPVTLFVGPAAVQHVYPRYGNLFVLAAVLLTAVPVLAALLGTGRRFLALLGAGYSLVLILLILVVNWSPGLQVQHFGVVLDGQRYSVAPCLFLCTAIAAGLDGLPGRHWPRVAVRAARIAVAAALVIAIAVDLAIAPPLSGPPWPAALADARRQCATGGPDGLIVHEPAGWFFVVPCAVLTN